MPANRLRQLLRQPGLLQVPGCYDGVSARLLERAGFPAAYLSGFGVAASALGLPDTGLMCFAEMAERVAAVAAAVGIPVIADGDTGYGGVGNVQRTVRRFARAGAAAVQIEDQVWPKRCGHTPGKQVVPLPEAVARVRAAADARERDIVLVARTDARAVHGFEEALRRCRAFVDAGADVIFCEAPESRAEMAALAEAVPAPLLANVVEGGRTPLLSRAELEALGYKIAIYPIALLLAAVAGMRRHLEACGGTRDFAPWPDAGGFAALQELVGFPGHDRLERRYAAQGPCGTDRPAPPAGGADCGGG